LAIAGYDAFTIKALMGPSRHEDYGKIYQGPSTHASVCFGRKKCPQIGHKWNTAANAGSRK